MKELREYRTSLLTRLKEAAGEFRAECLAARNPAAPLKENGWNTHQLAVHTRDVDEFVYGLRARRTALEDNPEFPNFDGDAFMAEHYDAGESLENVLNGFVRNVESLAEFLRGLPDEAWSRVSRHNMFGGGLTLQSWVEKDLAHIEEHLESVRKHKGIY